MQVALGNNVAVPRRVKHRVTVWPSNSTPTHIPKRMENKCPHKNLYVCVQSRTALFKMAKKWEQSKCLSIGECVNKMCYVHAADLAIKRNEVPMHATA